MIRQAYPSDLTDSQWEMIKAIVPEPKSGGRPAKYSRREVLNALLYLERTGCQWRALPHDLPPWKLVYWYFMDWRASGRLDHIYDHVRNYVPRARLAAPASMASAFVAGAPTIPMTPTNHGFAGLQDGSEHRGVRVLDGLTSAG